MKHYLLTGILAISVLACTPGTQNKQRCTHASCAPTDSMNIVLDLHRKVKPECVQAFKTAFAECKKETIKEAGCMDYGVYQSTEDSTEFFIHEEWTDQSALDKHGQTSHLKAFITLSNDMCTAKSKRMIAVCPNAQ